MSDQVINLRQHFQNQPYDVKKILKEFKKPIHDNVFFLNVDILRERSKFIRFDNDKWYMRPHLFCHHHYNEQYYYPIIFIVNNIGSVFDFKPDNFSERIIIAPTAKVIFQILSYSR